MEEEIGEATLATINDVAVISWAETEKRNVFDMDSFKKDHPELHAEYMIKKPGTRPFNEVEFDPDELEDE